MTNESLGSLNLNYPTRAGLAYLSQGSVFRGKDLHRDFTDQTWFELNLFGITGRQFNATELKILNYIWLSTSYADIRIWPNRISALASSARTTPILALVGGIASCDADLFVARPLVSCLCMYQRMKQALLSGQPLDSVITDELSKNKTLYGFGRPIASVDERVPHFIAFLHSLSADTGYCFKLAFKIDDFLRKNKNIQMNIAALYAAVCADLAFNAVEMNLFVSLLVVAGMPPCYLDSLEKPPGAFIPLKCSDINYNGVDQKKW